MSGQTYFSAIASNTGIVSAGLANGMTVTGTNSVCSGSINNICSTCTCGSCIYSKQKLKYSMNTIIIKPGYDLGILLPIDQFHVLDKIKLVSSMDYQDTAFRFSGKKLSFSLVNYQDILPEPPDPKIAQAKKEEYRKKLMEELATLDSEEKV
jgi:hypothetical protein